MPAVEVTAAVIATGVPHPTVGASLVLYHQYIEAMLASGIRLRCIFILLPDIANQAKVDEFRNSFSDGDRLDIYFIESDYLLDPNGFEIRDNILPVAQEIEKLGLQEAPYTITFDLAAAGIAKAMHWSNRFVWLGDLAFQSQWHNFLSGIHENPAQFRWLPYALVQRCKWKKVYKNFLSGSREIIVSSASSVTALNKLNIDSSYYPYPWPSPQTPIPIRNPQDLAVPTFLFFGNLVGLGSRSSLIFMFRHLYPRLIKLWGVNGFSILVAGTRELSPWAAQEIGERPEFRYLGYVEDLDEVFAKVHAVIVPVRAPVGNRSRILTAMSRAMPVIAHKNAALGNPDLTDTQTCFLASKAKDFVERMLFVATHHDVAFAVGDAGRRMYEERFSPQKVVSLFSDLFQPLSSPKSDT